MGFGVREGKSAQVEPLYRRTILNVGVSDSVSEGAAIFGSLRGHIEMRKAIRLMKCCVSSREQPSGIAGYL